MGNLSIWLTPIWVLSLGATAAAIVLLVALGAALALGTLAHRLGLPPMIGYIVAGLMVGPATPGPTQERTFSKSSVLPVIPSAAVTAADRTSRG